MARHRSFCLLAALVSAVLLGTVGCPNPAKTGDSTQITAAELAGRMRTRAAPLILDVRSRREYAAGHVPTAVNIPYNELAGRLGEMPVIL